MAGHRVALITLVRALIVQEPSTHGFRIIDFISLDAIVRMAKATLESLQATTMSATH
jgi:hypothetical protein